MMSIDQCSVVGGGASLLSFSSPLTSGKLRSFLWFAVIWSFFFQILVVCPLQELTEAMSSGSRRFSPHRVFELGTQGSRLTLVTSWPEHPVETAGPPTPGLGPQGLTLPSCSLG